MPWNCFIDIAMEHWFSCRTTEPGFDGAIGAIEIWLIDWLISVATFKKHLKTHLFELAFFPDTSMPNGPLMLQNCFFNFTVEHQFGCHTTQPGYAGDIGAIEIWLIHWLIDVATTLVFSHSNSHISCTFVNFAARSSNRWVTESFNCNLYLDIHIEHNYN